MPTLWPFIPEQEPGESLEWLTDVITCRSAEYRQALRASPRQEWAYDYSLTSPSYTRARELAKTIGGDDLYLPIWTERAEVGAISAHTVSLNVDATGTCYREGGLMLVWDGDDDCELATIGTIGTGTITLNPWVAGAYSNAVVCPIRTAKFAQDFEADKGVFDGICQARFRAVATEDVGDATALSYETWRGYPIVNDRGFVGARERYGREVATLDSRSGLVATSPVRSRPGQSGTMSWEALDAAGAWNLRKWIHSRRGRQKAFYLPTWSDELTVSSAISAGSDHIHITRMGFGSTYALPCDFILYTKSGPFFQCRVTGVQVSGAEEILALSAVLFQAGVTIQPSDVDRFCRMILCRFEADRVELQHGLAGALRTSVPIVEVPA